MIFRTIDWKRHKLYLLDQRRLPGKEFYQECSSLPEVASAIRKMIVRGAPAIGVSAAFGMVLGAEQCRVKGPTFFLKEIERMGQILSATRPTAVNLLWAIERMKQITGENIHRGIPWVRKRLEMEAMQILREDIRANRKIGRFGQTLLPRSCSVLTHCNAGALATAGYGTALGVIRAAVAAGKKIHVFVDETRPFLQGARLTAWELMKEKIPCTLIADNMAGALMAQGKIDLAIVGADRIAANGDVANKIGTYAVACLCHLHKIPFYVAAPVSTIDMATKNGAGIPIEERSQLEIITCGGKKIAPPGIQVLNPSFDVTPNRLIHSIITEKGIIQKPFSRKLKKMGVERRRLDS
jgi:methylthioribose-1-phosphate isomerase